MGLALSVIHGWVPYDDPRLADLRDPEIPPSPPPTPEMEKAARAEREGGAGRD
jgi:hypothetical protein